MIRIVGKKYKRLVLENCIYFPLVAPADDGLAILKLACHARDLSNSFYISNKKIALLENSVIITDMETDLKSSPLKKSIYLRCIFFVALLGAIITFVNYEAFQKNLNKRNQIYLSDIINFTEFNIDKKDLEECSKTLQKTPAYFQLQKFINKIVNNYNVDNIYIVKPLNNKPYDNCLCLISGFANDKLHQKIYSLGRKTSQRN